MFYKGFRFGIGVSSYQVEGGYNLDHKVPSIWDVFTTEPGAISDHSDGKVALDFYHRYEEDIMIAKDLGIQDFRLSLSWCRILNEDQSVNMEGVAFYRRVLSCIREHGLNPVCTLFHWDLPEYLDEKGGWVNRDIVKCYSTYVQAVSDYLSDLVTDFLTFNEPQCFIGLGLTGKEHAPSRKTNLRDLLAASHHVLLAHAAAYQILKKKNPKCEVGFVNTITIPIPEDRNNQELEKACYEELFNTRISAEDFYTVSLYMDPLYLGHYPQSILSDYKKEYGTIIQKGDMELIQKAKQTTVYLNIYTGHKCRLISNKLVSLYDSDPKDSTSFEWLKAQPESLYYGPKYVYERYHLPIVISENGVCYEDKLCNEKVHDENRIQFIESYLQELDKANQDNIPIKAYYYWSLFDNFEWAYGYTKRFGLVYIDYNNNLKRIKKDSFHTLQKIIKEVK